MASTGTPTRAPAQTYWRAAVEGPAGCYLRRRKRSRPSSASLANLRGNRSPEPGPWS